MKRTTMNRTLRWVTLLVAAAVTVPAHANDGPYIGLEGGYNIERDLVLYDINNGTSDRLRFKDGPLGNDGVVGGLVFGHAFWFGLRPELAFNYRRNQLERSTNSLNITNTNVSGRQELYSAMGNLWYDIKTPTGFFSVVHPYLGAGIGWGRLSLRSPSANGLYGPDSFDSALAWQFGTGIGIDLNRVVTLTADYRHVRTREQRLNFDGQADGRYRADSAMVGVRFALGSPPREVVVVQAPVRTPPPPPPPPAPDRCAMDADGDGVGDCEDKCANSPRGFKVDSTGCIIEQSVILRSVNFVFNKEELTMPARDTLDQVAAALVGQPALNVQIKGHTDSVGTDAYNRGLSQRRAESVRRYLISKGVRDANLQAIGAGEDQPIATNNTEEGRAENRRVEFVVLNKPANVTVKSAESTERSKQAAEAGEPAHVKKNKNQ